MCNAAWTLIARQMIPISKGARRVVRMHSRWFHACGFHRTGVSGALGTFHLQWALVVKHGRGRCIYGSLRVSGFIAKPRKVLTSFSSSRFGVPHAKSSRGFGLCVIRYVMFLSCGRLRWREMPSSGGSLSPMQHGRKGHSERFYEVFLPLKISDYKKILYIWSSC
jgi:hypothetical protein